MLVEIRTRGGLAAEWTAANTVLAEREQGLETDTGQFKWGDGVTPWNALPYASAGGGGASDADTANNILAGALTPAALDTRDDDILEKNQRGLRAFHVALGSIATTPVDVGILPSDSIGEGAYAGAWDKIFVNVMRDTLRRAVQPAGIKGGKGYFGFGSSLILSGQGYIGVTGSVAITNQFGLGRKAFILQNGAQWSYYFEGDSAELVYSTDPSYGSFTYTVDGGAPSAPVVCSGATSHGNKVLINPGNAATHTIVVTSTGVTALEGNMGYSGDRTAGGIRTWEGAHSGYSAQNYLADMDWVDSIAAIPNLRLLVLPIGSNDFFTGRTTAQAKADIQAIIAAVRAKVGHDFSIALVSYYDRPPGAAVTSWAQYVKMYREIAMADDDIAWVDFTAAFGPMESPTDDRGGLTTALPGDYVHPTPAGHALLGERIAQFVLPPGSEANGGAFNNTLDVNKPVSTLQAAADLAAAAGLPYTALGNFAGGAMAFNLLPVADYSMTLTGNVTLSPSGMPPVTAGRTSEFCVRFTQDATGSRTLTLDPLIKTAGAVTLAPAAGAITYVMFKFDGISWWAFNMSDPTLSTTQAALVALNAGDQQLAYSAAFPGGAITLSSFGAGVYHTFRLVLGGAVSFSAAAKPVIAAGRAFTFRLVLVQDATGNRVMTWNANVLTAAGVDPVLSTAPNAIDVAEFLWTGTELIMTNFVKGAA